MTGKMFVIFFGPRAGLPPPRSYFFLPESLCTRLEQMIETATGPYWNFSLIHLGGLDVTPSFVVTSILYIVFLAYVGMLPRPTA